VRLIARFVSLGVAVGIIGVRGLRERGYRSEAQAELSVLVSMVDISLTRNLCSCAGENSRTPFGFDFRLKRNPQIETGGGGFICPLRLAS
jgi:hypothetical protein